MKTNCIRDNSKLTATWWARVCYGALLVVVLSVACTWVGPEKEWNNPYDRISYCIPEIDSVTRSSEVRIGKVVTFTAHVRCHDDSIVKYFWSVDRTSPMDSTIEMSRNFTWGIEDTGTRILQVKAVNAFGRTSNVFTDTVSLHVSYPFIISPIPDTSVHQFAQIKKALTAGDTDGKIVKYYWRTGEAGWTDSSTSATDAIIVVQNALGGPVRVVWAVVDDDGLMVLDTFSINFNRGPDSIALLKPAAGKVASFESYSILDNIGKVACAFAAFDRDSNDAFVYSLTVVDESADTLLSYQGKDSTALIEGVTGSSTLRYWLKAKDAFGDSAMSTGTFTVQRPPSLPEGMVPVSRGAVKAFRMGQTGFDSSESPIHAVQFSNSIVIDTTEVTNAEYARIVFGKVDNSDTATFPVTGVSWVDAVLFCNKKSIAREMDTVYVYSGVVVKNGVIVTLENLKIRYQTAGFRLPTEAEWEYANRLDSLTLYFWGNDHTQASVYSWTRDNSSDRKHKVATKRPSRNNLYDMAGNVWEWCNDWFASDYYQKSPSLDPAGPDGGTQKVIRGGSYQNSNYFVQSGTRSKLEPSFKSTAVGFRTVMTIR